MIKEILTILRESPEPFSRLYEALRLRVGGHRLTLNEYIDYQLHTDRELTAKERQRFVGHDRKWRIHVRCNQKQWFMLHYKIPFTQFMMATEMAAPKIFAVYGEGAGKHLPGAILLSTEEEVIEWLRHDAPYPLFVKPNDAMLGEGAIGLTAYSNENNKLTLTNGALESMEVFVQQLRNKSSGGILFQELLRPNPEVARICGQAISSLRITLGRTAKGLQILSACWRIPTGNNMIDNFRHGISGNLLGGIDTSTGKVTRVCGRVGNKIDPVKHHPDTGFPFENISIPDWSRVIDICTLAGEYIPGLGLQNWDVALTDRGPVITEINVFGDMDVHQFANRRGFRSDALEESLEYFYPIYLSELSWLQRKLTPLLRNFDSLR